MKTSHPYNHNFELIEDEEFHSVYGKSFGDEIGIKAVLDKRRWWWTLDVMRDFNQPWEKLDWKSVATFESSSFRTAYENAIDWMYEKYIKKFAGEVK